MSLRMRLTLYYTGVLALCLFLFGMGLYVVSNKYLEQQTDRMLVTTALHVSNTFRVISDPQQVQRIVLPDVNVFSNPWVYLQVIDDQGQVITKSQNLGSQVLPHDNRTISNAKSGSAFFGTVDAEGEKLRIYNYPIVLQSQLAGVLQVGRAQQPQRAFFAELAWFLTLVSLITLLFAAGLGFILARLALAPVEQMTNVAAHISETQDLGKRVDYQGPADEIGRLASTFNMMLERLAMARRSLEDAYAAQLRFVADVSHELRTPLTTIRGNLELLERLNPVGDLEQREILGDAVAESGRMVRLVHNLLMLARAEAGRHIDKGPVQLGEVVQAVARQATHLGESRFTTEHLELLEQAVAIGSEDYLKQLLLILLDNAFKYTPANGQVTMTGLSEKGWWGIRVTDTGPGIASEDRKHIFDRFYQAGNRRSGGSGLGLAIANWIAVEHNGRIEVSSEVGQGSSFTFWLPAA
ncbi:MAG: HAMP domain-containing sensor histidine kinase [Thermacetogeniaceae bacterium]